MGKRFSRGKPFIFTAAAIFAAALILILITTRNGKGLASPDTAPAPAADPIAGGRFPARQDAGFPAAPPPEAFAGRAACADCHAAETEAWSRSDHALAMAPADSSSVLGRFEGDSLAFPGGVARFHAESGKYLVRVPGPDGRPTEYPVRYTFGARPLQQYLVDFPGGRMQALSTAWDVSKQEWFHLYPDSAVAPDDWLHWSRDGQNWNGMCADCHSTGLRRGYDAALGTFNTTWKDIDVSCEACHGPAAGHVAWARAGRLERAVKYRGARETHGLVWDRMSQGGRAEIMACARCHARRSALKEDFGYALEFLDEYTPQLLTPGTYHADGQILEEDYEYGSFLQSRMYHEGVHCSDCHEPHTLKVRAQGNALCTRCHEAARFDVAEHHRHAAGSPGALCVNCHMPTRTYMRIDVRRDHSLRVPRPDLGIEYGTPDACTQCHTDKPQTWAAERIAAWHGPKRKPHFSELLAEGRAGGQGADSALDRLAADIAWPAIVRASAVALLSEYMNGLAQAAIVRGARDREPLVRLASASAAERLPDGERLEAAAPLLRDSLRAVRAAAANALITVSPLIPDTLRTAFNHALAEQRTALAANAYFPAGRFNLGQYHEKRGETDSAVIEYRAALAIDDRFLPARMNLGQLEARLGWPDSAAAMFREALRRYPAYADAHYSLGLLYSEQGRDDSAVAHMAAAEKGMRGNPRVSYNLGLLLRKLGRPAEAEAALRRSVAAGGGNPEFLYTLAWFYATRSRWNEARELLGQVAGSNPGYPGLMALMQAVAQRRLPGN